MFLLSPAVTWAINNPRKFFLKYSHPERWGFLIERVATLWKTPRGYLPISKIPYEQFQDMCVNQLSIQGILQRASGIKLSNINLGNKRVSVMIEGRNLPQNEFVIINTITQLGPGWDHVIYCSWKNFLSIRKIIRKYDLRITLRFIPASFSRNDYNELLLSTSFWNSLSYEWVLIYQTDTYIFEPLDDLFFNYDYIGACWTDESSRVIAELAGFEQLVTVGNGGLSLRNVPALKRFIQTEDFIRIKSKNNLHSDLISAPEDVVFSYLVQKFGRSAPQHVAHQFSKEHIAVSRHEHLFGCHQPYLNSPGNILFRAFKEKINGLNIAGFINYSFGLAQNARNIADALHVNNRPLFLNELPIGAAYTQRNSVTSNHWYQKNLICCNPDYDYVSVLGEDYFTDKKNAAVWAWELEQVPKWWLPHADRFEVIFTVSQFCEDVLKKTFPQKTVVALPLPGMRITKQDTQKSKAVFGFDTDTFLFLFMFDGSSDFYRKNPDTLITSFKKAFPHIGKERLVIKSHNVQPRELQKLKQVIAGDSRITLITETLSEEKITTLLNACDVYVSLHRSEGFGLTLLEAISIEKPVICTGWSGNLDFCKPEWSLLVDYTMTPVHLESHYYRMMGDSASSCSWADPNIFDAASKMREIVAHYPKYAIGARKGAVWVRDNYYDLSKTAALINKYL